MLWYYVPALFMLLQSALSFPREKTTEKPVSAMANPKQRRPSHISEFTDPDTGLNPFLDLEEGLDPKGRNVMEDERRDYEPHFDIDLVEGDAPDRRWDLHEPREHLPGRMPARRPEPDYKDESDYFAVVTTPLVIPNPPTTVEVVATRGMDGGAKSDTIEEENKEIRHKFKKEEQESFMVSQSTVIYATVAVAVMTVIILLVGACWWRRKSKTMRPSTSVESGEVKS